ncbi:hypothetical protein E3N88_10450 [Mikania micrantha]|uniref:DDE Tnp4 domain-containing protein n=1 Tax=Mikania micrantha TaxID=192012 RepID=A0A5N6PBS9_9ASTR|nr:hypothetical protein E3N88_10450 [Mikania micrantha]
MAPAYSSPVKLNAVKQIHFYVLPGYEGSVAADGRILRNAMIRENGLQVPKGNYYLVDVKYTKGEGFLAPFRGQRYHLNT